MSRILSFWICTLALSILTRGFAYNSHSFDDIKENITGIQNELNIIYEGWRYTENNSGYQGKEFDPSRLNALEEKLTSLRESIEQALRRELNISKNRPSASRSVIKEKRTTLEELIEKSSKRKLNAPKIHSSISRNANEMLELYLRLYIDVVKSYSAIDPTRLEDINGKMAITIPNSIEVLPIYRTVIVARSLSDNPLWHTEVKKYKISWWHEYITITISLSQDYINNVKEKDGGYLRMALGKDDHPQSLTPFEKSRMERILLEVIKRYLIESLQEDLDTTNFLLRLREPDERERERKLRHAFLEEVRESPVFVELFVFKGANQETLNTNRESYKIQKGVSLFTEIMGFPRPFINMSEQELQDAFCEILIRSRRSFIYFSERTDDDHDCRVELPKINLTEIVESVQSKQEVNAVLDRVLKRASEIKGIYDDENTPMFKQQDLDEEALVKYTLDRMEEGDYQSEDESFFNFLGSMPDLMEIRFKQAFHIESSSPDRTIEGDLEKKIKRCHSINLENAYSVEYLVCLNQIISWSNGDEQRAHLLEEFIEKNEGEYTSSIIDDISGILDEGSVVSADNVPVMDDIINKPSFTKYTNGSIQFDLDPEEQMEIFRNYSFYERVKEVPILGTALNRIRWIGKRKVYLDYSCSPFNANPEEKAICQEIISRYSPYLSVRHHTNIISPNISKGEMVAQCYSLDDETSDEVRFFCQSIHKNLDKLDEKKLARAIEIAQLFVELGQEKRQALYTALTEDDEEKNRRYMELALWQTKYDLENEIDTISRWDNLNDAQVIAKHAILDQLLSNHELLSLTYLSWKEQVERKFPNRHKYKQAGGGTLFLRDPDTTKGEIALTTASRRVLFFGFSALLALQYGGPVFSALRFHRAGSMFTWLFQGLTSKGIQNFSRLATGMILTDIGIHGHHTLYRYPQEYQTLKALSMGNPSGKSPVEGNVESNEEIEPLEIKDLAMMEEYLARQQRQFYTGLTLDSLFLANAGQFLGPSRQMFVRASEPVNAFRQGRRSSKITGAFDELGMGSGQTRSWDIDIINRALNNRLSTIDKVIPIQQTQDAIRKAQKAHDVLLKKIRQVRRRWTRYAQENMTHFRRLGLDTNVNGWRQFARLDRRNITDDLLRESIDTLDNFLQARMYLNRSITIEEYGLFYNMMFASRAQVPGTLPTANFPTANLFHTNIGNGLSPGGSISIRVAKAGEPPPVDLFYQRFFHEKTISLDAAHAVFGIDKSASLDDVITIYRALTKKWHPDYHPGNQQEATRVFRIISGAYDVLTTHPRGVR